MPHGEPRSLRWRAGSATIGEMSREPSWSELRRYSTFGEGLGVAAIGSFDGLHRSHRRLVDSTLALADLRAVDAVAVVLDDLSAPTLTGIDERCGRLTELGFGRVEVLSFPSRAEQPASALADALVARIPDTTVLMSCADRGDTVRLPELLLRRGVDVIEVVRETTPDGDLVTGALIRQALADGDVRRAGAMLGAPFALVGEVVHGNKIGRTIGFPTANVATRPGAVVPGHGVYAGVADTGSGTYACAVNIGVRPTIDDAPHVTVEAHLIDFDGDLYGADLRVEFVDRIRPEQRFASLADLRGQLARDVIAAARLVDLQARDAR